MTPMRSAFISTAIGTAERSSTTLCQRAPGVEHGEDVGEAHDREEVAQPRAGLGHQQLVDPEVDHVAVEEDRHVHHPHEGDADLRGEELQRGVDLPVEELRQGQHEDEMQHRRPEEEAAGEAEADEDQPAHPDDERVEDEVVDLHEVAEEREERAPAPMTATPGQRSVTGRAGGGTNFISRRNM